MVTIDVNGRKFIPLKYAEGMVEEERSQFRYDIEDIKTEIQKRDEGVPLTVSEEYQSKGLQEALAIVTEVFKKTEQRWARTKMIEAESEDDE